METTTKIIGDEFDRAVRDALRETLSQLGAIKRSGLQGVAGSQDLESMEFDLQGRLLVVEAETYVGLTISGAPDLVQTVADEVERRLHAVENPR